MNMKNIFKREDGTFKIINTTAFVLVIAFLLMLLIIKLTFEATPITERHYNTTTTTTTEPTTMKMCNNCNIKFKRSKVTIKSNTEIDLDELLSVSNMSMYQVRFKDYDKDLISINMNSLTIKSLDKIGSTTLVAYYEDVELEYGYFSFMKTIRVKLSTPFVGNDFSSKIEAYGIPE